MPRLAWPMLFRLQPSDLSFAPRATSVIDHRAHIAAPPEVVFDELVSLAHGREWLEHYLHVEWEGAAPAPVPPDPRVLGRPSDQTFRFMTLRVRVVVAERGRRLVSSVEACSLPLARWMVEEVTFEPTPDGGTDFRWTISSEALAVTRPLLPLIQPLFDGLFRRSTARLAAFCARLP
ncbi:MAG: SRPBCC family protein [Deltaproteobacteria bacterium]|nr:SRPBCC family protein [Myxococcales bacterium]MDP3213099.1 SRPBCC family protein [Deltaproteobacteria bacterium]